MKFEEVVWESFSIPQHNCTQINAVSRAYITSNLILQHLTYSLSHHIPLQTMASQCCAIVKYQPPKVAFVSGANGISGHAIVEHLIRKPESEWYGYFPSKLSSHQVVR